MDILGKQTENNGSLSESELVEILTSSDYSTKGTLSDNGEESVLQKTLTSSDGKYQISVSEIYNSSLEKAKTSKKLTEIVKNTDYGKSINYSVTVNGTTLNDWKVFLNDGNNVYIILSGNLAGNLMPNLGYPVANYGGWYGLEYESEGTPEEIIDCLGSTVIFMDFANGRGASSATGAPTLEQFEASYGHTIKEGDVLQGALYTERRLLPWYYWRLLWS